MLASTSHRKLCAQLTHVGDQLGHDHGENCHDQGNERQVHDHHCRAAIDVAMEPEACSHANAMNRRRDARGKNRRDENQDQDVANQPQQRSNHEKGSHNSDFFRKERYVVLGVERHDLPLCEVLRDRGFDLLPWNSADHAAPLHAVLEEDQERNALDVE